MEKKGGKDKMLECRMGVQTLSDPMKESEVLILAGRLHHDGDPVLTWAVSNVVGRLDAKDNVYPRKDKPEKKIDPAVAMIMALRGAVVVKKPTQPGFLLL
jgi:phage terminase large subunit-like protein